MGTTQPAMDSKSKAMAYVVLLLKAQAQHIRKFLLRYHNNPCLLKNISRYNVLLLHPAKFMATAMMDDPVVMSGRSPVDPATSRWEYWMRVKLILSLSFRFLTLVYGACENVSVKIVWSFFS